MRAQITWIPKVPTWLDVAQFWASVLVDEPAKCWPYLGHKNSNGYGRITGGRIVSAHRYAYEIAYGPIPDTIDGERAEIDHTCRRRDCCNPGHLRAVKRSVNQAARMLFNSQKTRCHRGHEFGYRTPDGRRQCLVCRAAAQRKYLASQRAYAARKIETDS